MKKRNKFISTLAAAAMVAVMAGATLPTTALAEGTNDALPLSKNVELQSDGTYTLTLSAYATGELKITEEKVPLDIVLVLDQSGSMADPFEYEYDVSYEQFTGSYWKSYSTPVYHQAKDGYHELNVTRTAVYKTIPFIGKVLTGYKYSYDCEYCGEHIGANSCAGAGFAQFPMIQNWGKNILTKKTISTEVPRLDALKDAAKSFITNVRTDATANKLDHRIAVVGFASESGHGNNTEILTVEGNNTNIDNDTAIGVAYENLTNEIKSQALVSSGERIIDQAIENLAASGATRADLGMEMAKEILSLNKKDGRKQVVIMFTDGSPTSSNDFEIGVANQAIAYSKDMKDAGVDVYTVGIFKDANGDESINNATSNENKFMHATSSNYLQAKSMEDVGTLNKLGYYMSAKNAGQLKDVFNAISQSVTGSTTVTLGSESVLKDIISDNFKLPDNATAEGNITAKVADYRGKGSDGDREFGAPYEDRNLSVGLSDDKKTITVSGFSYKENYVADGVNGSAPTGKKLIVTIKGLEAQPTAATGSPVDTNAVGSGIYENSKLVTPVKEFVSPTVIIPKESYVLDYAKTATLPTDDNFNRTNVQTNMAKINKSSGNKLTLNYGNVDFENQSLKYTPTKMNWDGYDTFYTFGNKDSKIDWHQINVIPANNVYYEDTFVTDETGTVGIVYSADNWQTATEGTNTGDASNDEHGWITSMDDDKTDSDGTVATGSAGATATFSFTGTGVDIYSRTDMDTGLVVAKLYEGKDTTTPASMVKSLTVDNLAQSGTYYQIPTVSFSGLKHGAYTVKLKVVSTTKTTGNERSTYYLDGIRVYNPLSAEQEEKDIVKEAYGDEIGASFQSVRDILIVANSLEDGAQNVSGAVFIDYNPDKDENDTATSATIKTYEDYGPKNEVYLAQGQAIAFHVDTEVSKLSVGLKAPSGATTAQVTNGDNTSPIDINAASDQYYEIAPNTDGYVIIKNTGNQLLSVTKLKMRGEPIASTGAADFSMNVDTAMAYANSFDSLPVVAYTLMDAETAAPDAGEAQEPEQGDADIETPEEPEQGDVVIENPEEPAPVAPSAPVSDSWISELFRAIRKILWR